MKETLIKIGKGILYVFIGGAIGAVILCAGALLPIGVNQGDAAVVGAVMGGAGGLWYGARQKFA